MGKLTRDIVNSVLKEAAATPPPSFLVLVTDWGVTPLPQDMQGLCRLRKDGFPDQRSYKAAKKWLQRFREETEKLSTAYGS